jgi:hypothetical protein
MGFTSGLGCLVDTLLDDVRDDHTPDAMLREPEIKCAPGLPRSDIAGAQKARQRRTTRDGDRTILARQRQEALLQKWTF